MEEHKPPHTEEKITPEIPAKLIIDSKQFSSNVPYYFIKLLIYRPYF